MSELVLDGESRLKLDQDYWDASKQSYSRLPVIGRLMSRIGSLASVS